MAGNTSRFGFVVRCTGATLVVCLAGCTSPFFARNLGPVLYPDAAFTLPNASCTLALTIDDAPSLVTTPAIADVLAEHGATATFFVIGDRITPGTRPLLERLLREGHELANHTFAEVRSQRLSAAAFEESVARTHALLVELSHASGTPPSPWFRPGSGLYNRRMRDVVTGPPYHYDIALGDVFPLDTNHCSVGRSSRFIGEHVRRGSIIVLHDADTTEVLRGTGVNPCRDLRGERTAEVLARVLPTLTARGFQVATLSAAATADTGSGCN